MARYVLDASALLVLLGEEQGSERVIESIIEGAAISTVNLSEVVAKLSDGGMAEDEIGEALGSLELTIADFGSVHAYRTGLLRLSTKHAGLSLGDRACLALAEQLNLPALTADRAWKDLALHIVVEVIR